MNDSGKAFDPRRKRVRRDIFGRPLEAVTGGMAEPDPLPPPFKNRKQRRAEEKVAKLRRNAFVKAAKRRIRKNEALLEKLAKIGST